MKWLCVIALAGCQVAPSDLGSLADGPPAPFSVKITGGAFVDGAGGPRVLDRTYPPQPGGAAHFEAIPLDQITRALRTARAFVRVAQDERAAATRAGVSSAARSDRGAAVQQILDEAAAEGHDYVLSVQRLADGAIHEYGINARWPITAVAWLILGIGMVIPDHTYESGAELHFALRDVHSGQVVYERVLDGDPVDLALVDRTGLWGLVQSIVVPPFWVSSDDAKVVAEVRRATTQRLLFLLAQDLKSVGCVNDLMTSAPARIELSRERDAVRILISAIEGLSFVRVRVDQSGAADVALDEFARELLRSGRVEASRVSYGGVCAVPDGGRFLQVLVQTVGGRVASTTIDLRVRSGEQ